MTERIKFTVYRDTWYRGKGPYDSVLLNDFGSRCCLGHMGRDVGLSDLELLNTCTPLGTHKKQPWPLQLFDMDNNKNSRLAYQLMATNDDDEMRDEDREVRLTSLLAEHGIDVEFKDGSGEESSP